MNHDIDTALPCCEQAWPLSEDERDQAYADGMPSYVLDGLEHLCALEPQHDGPCTCSCGAAR